MTDPYLRFILIVVAMLFAALFVYELVRRDR